ncbi:MAG: RNA polymerase factor sigma-54 [Ignavibacteria bacterium]|nr:RNA polymerase factor sigma-54 [Ignavibacteria bacterium]
MKPTITTTVTVTQTLTPQQIQYLKLLQMPLQQLEQQVSEEIEENPFLEISDSADDSELEGIDIELPPTTSSVDNIAIDSIENLSTETIHQNIPESRDPFEFYRRIWEEDEIASRKFTQEILTDDEESEPYPIKQTSSFIQEMLQQFRLLHLKFEEQILGEQILGNVDSDGYLRVPLEEIVDDTNAIISELINESKTPKNSTLNNKNPAVNYTISEEIKRRVDEILNQNSTTNDNNKLSYVTIDDAERILKIIQQLDPPGVASRNLQECLLAQTLAYSNDSPGREQALKILTEAYEPFTKKHFQILQKQFGMTPEEIKKGIDFIKKLNPKPGVDDTQSEQISVIPDFTIERDFETNELLISLNESTIPPLRINKTYEKMRKDVELTKRDKEAREWLRTKYDQAKFLIQALSQRKATMLKVMTAIAGRQKDFFEKGPSALKPMIYKDISDDTGLDVATVCRIVNNKYVQTEYGTFELKYFFSEALPTDNGEEVSTKVIKQIIKEMIDSEPKDEPFSDEKISLELKKRGYNVARRTVAKYREQMKIPVARLRKEL